MKAMNLCDATYDGPTLDYFNFGCINLNFLSRNNISKKDNLRSKEFTLFKFSIQDLLPQNFEHSSEMFLMRCFVLAIYQDIIKIYHYKFPNKRPQNLIHGCIKVL